MGDRIDPYCPHCYKDLAGHGIFIDAYHAGQNDALDAVLSVLEERLRREWKIPYRVDHHCYVAARSGRRHGVSRAIDKVRHLRETINTNQAIKDALRRKQLKEDSVADVS